MHFFAYSAIVFLVPFFMGHPQLLVGSVVNAALFLAAFNMKFRETLPVILLPSIAVLTKGLIFGPYTIFLIIMMPFIWLGNSIIVYLFKYLHMEKNVNSIYSGIIASVSKVAFLFLSALVLYKASLIPIIFLTTMGLFQLYTALIGLTAALAINKGIEKVKD